MDLAKNVFQVHGVDAAGKVLVRRQLRRRQMEKFLAALPVGVVVGMEACGGAHHWGRLVRAPGAADAGGLCEALRQAQQERRARC